MPSPLVSRARYYVERFKDHYDSLSTSSKIAFWSYWILHFVITAFIIYIGPTEWLSMMAGWAESAREMGSQGRIVLLSLIILFSFPPLFGYGTSVTLCGFAFGTFEGWIIAASGCIIGALLSFTLVRSLLNWFNPLFAKDKTFKALGRAVRVKGLPLVILIRLCPFPFPYSNAFFASIETVSIFQFLLATLCITPKLLLHVWVGSRMYLFASPSSRERMDPRTKFVNLVFVVLGTLLGVGTSYYLYRLTMRYIETGEGDIELGPDHSNEEEEEEQGGLMRDLDEMLGHEDDDDNDEGEGTRSGEEGLRKLDLRRGSKMSLGNGGGAGGEDWEGSISDFGDHETRKRLSLDGSLVGDEGDLWGLNEDADGLDTIEEGESLDERR